MRWRRKAMVLALLERGPATTGDVRRECECANAAQALGTLGWLRDCGIVVGERVPRVGPGSGARTTTMWRLVA